MKKFGLIILAVLLLIAGFWMFKVGIILLKAFIGLMLISIFAAGIYIGRITKK